MDRTLVLSLIGKCVVVTVLNPFCNSWENVLLSLYSILFVIDGEMCCCHCAQSFLSLMEKCVVVTAQSFLSLMEKCVVVTVLNHFYN